jgi:hypothetical protein
MTVAGTTFSSIYQNRLPESWYQGGAIVGSWRPTANGNERLPCGIASAF